MLIGSDCLCKVQLDYFYFLMASDRTLNFGNYRPGTVVDIQSSTYASISFLLQANDRAEWVDNFLSGVRQFLLEDAADFKIF
jgi:hypothetical protein